MAKLMKKLLKTINLYHTLGLAGLLYSVGVFWTEPLVVILRGGPVLPYLEVGRWLLLAAVVPTGWAAARAAAPAVVRWLATTVTAGVFLQLGRAIIGVDSPVLVGLRWCWIVRESTLVQRGDLLNSVYSTELARLFGGVIPPGVATSLGTPSVETLLWGDLVTLGTARAVHEHTTWLVQTISTPVTPPPPGWADWFTQWGPTVGLVLTGVMLAGMVYWYSGSGDDSSSQSQVLEDLATKMADLGIELTGVIAQTERLEKTVASDRDNFIAGVGLANNRCGILLSKLNRVVQALLVLTQVVGPPDTIMRMEPEEVAARIRAATRIDVVKYLSSRGGRPPS